MVMSPRASLREALEAITKNGRQAVLVADAEGVLAGMVTDGDLRRAILRGVPLDGVVADIMNPAPVTASPGLGRAAAVELMLARAIRHRPWATRGALLLLRERLRQPFFVVNADVLTRCDFRAMWEFHRRQGRAAMTVGVSTHQVDIPYGEFTLHGERVTRVEEKPRKEVPDNAGLYLLDPSAV